MKFSYGVATIPCLLLLIGCNEEKSPGKTGSLNSAPTPAIAEAPRKAAPPTVSTATIAGCGSAEAFDTGRIVYLITAGDCEPPVPIQVDFEWGTAKRSSRKTGQFQRFDEPVPFTFTSESPEEVPGSRVVSIHRAHKWHSLPNEDAWPWRDGAGLLNFNGALYLIGGWSSDENVQGEVWRTYDLENWELLTNQAPWNRQHSGTCLVHRGRMYMIGGDPIDGTWSSDDGINWRPEATGTPYGGRYTPNVVSDGQRILLYAGQNWDPDRDCGGSFGIECAAVGLNDVWTSDDGREWIQLLAAAPWSPRALVHGGAFFNGRTYVIGGGLKAVAPNALYSETVAEFSDIWSTADGIDWRLEATELGFAPRTHFALLATNHGCYVANGSVVTQSNFSSEVFFAPDCVHFSEVQEPSTMGIRHASSLAEFNGSIVVLGGHRDTAGTRIWQYFPARTGVESQ